MGSLYDYIEVEGSQIFDKVYLGTDIPGQQEINQTSLGPPDKRNAESIAPQKVNYNEASNNNILSNNKEMSINNTMDNKTANQKNPSNEHVYISEELLKFI